MKRIIENIAGAVPSVRRVRESLLESGNIPGSLWSELNRCSVLPQISCPRETERAFEDGQVVLICHHTGHYPGALYLLASVPRKDTVILVDRTAWNFWTGNVKLENLIYIHGVSHQKAPDLKSKAIRLFTRKYLENSSPNFRKRVELNAQAYEEALEKLKEGKVVAITPDGGYHPQDRWNRRIGELVNNMDNDWMIVFSHINDSPLTILAFTPGIGESIGPLLPKGKVHFSEPLKVKNIKSYCQFNGHPEANNRETTHVLQNMHRFWVNTLR